MARPPLPLGSWGRVRRDQLGPSSWVATTYFRDFDGRTRQVTRRGSNGAKAERRLLEAVANRARVGRLGEISADTRLADVAPYWIDQLRRAGREATTLDAYSDSLTLHVLPGLGALQLREISVGVADRFLQKLADTTGHGAAKHARTVLSGLLGLAVRHDALEHNPIRDVSPISQPRSPARAMTLQEVQQLRTGVRADKRAVDRDLPALVDFMLGTGLRIGETLAVVWDAIDLEAGTVEVRATVVRTKGAGLVLKPKPKTASGWRQLHLPVWLVDQLRDREYLQTEWDVVFPSQRGKLRDRSNTSQDLRDVLDPLGFGWITSHTFRKTAATLLDAHGLTVREIADQLGHANVSMTQNVYFGRGQASKKVATALHGIAGEDGTETKPVSKQ